MSTASPQRLGIALGSGAARGWAHIGVLRGLAELDIHPNIVCGTSAGAIVAAAYASNRLDALETWLESITRWDVIRLMEWGNSGLTGSSLMDAFCQHVPEQLIEALPHPFGCVATDIHNGREVWFTRGSLRDAVRASIALPGLLRPVAHDGRWLVDGGLVDPVPVSLCRALGADRVIAVSLNGLLMQDSPPSHAARRPWAGDLLEGIGQRLTQILGNNEEPPEAQAPTPEAPSLPGPPNLFDLMAGSLHILQDRLARSRLAGDPPDLVLSPRVGHLALLDFQRVKAAVAAGRACVTRHRSLIADTLAQKRGFA